MEKRVRTFKNCKLQQVHKVNSLLFINVPVKMLIYIDISYLILSSLIGIYVQLNDGGLFPALERGFLPIF